MSELWDDGDAPDVDEIQDDDGWDESDGADTSRLNRKRNVQQLFLLQPSQEDEDEASLEGEDEVEIALLNSNSKRPRLEDPSDKVELSGRLPVQRAPPAQPHLTNQALISQQSLAANLAKFRSAQAELEQAALQGERDLNPAQADLAFMLRTHPFSITTCNANEEAEVEAEAGQQGLQANPGSTSDALTATTLARRSRIANQAVAAAAVPSSTKPPPAVVNLADSDDDDDDDGAAAAVEDIDWQQAARQVAAVSSAAAVSQDKGAATTADRGGIGGGSKVQLVFRTKAGQTVKIKVGLSDPLQQAFCRFLEHATSQGWVGQGAVAQGVRFVLDGDKLVGNETAGDLDLEDDMIIDVHC